MGVVLRAIFAAAVPLAAALLLAGGYAGGVAPLTVTDHVLHRIQGLLATFSFNVVAGDPVEIGNPLDPNSPSLLDAGGPYSVDEGSVLALDWTATDPDSDPL